MTRFAGQEERVPHRREAAPQTPEHVVAPPSPAANPLLVQQQAVGNLAVQRQVRDGRLPAHVILGQQQTLGNQAVQRLLRAQAVQRQDAAALPQQPDPDRATATVQLAPAGTLAQVMSEPETATLARPSMSQAPLATPPVVQRKTGVIQRSASGLAATKATTDFAGEGYTFWKDTANKDKPLKDLTDHLMTKVNAKLPHPCLHAYGASGSDLGSFSRVTWTINFNPSAFSNRSGVSKVGDLNQAEVAEIVDTAYHESRHSEQYFRIAQMLAGQGKKADEIKTGMSIPKSVADAAAAAPLKGDTKANKKLIEEAKGWEQITIGKYGALKGEIAGLRDEINELKGVFSTGSDATKMTGLDPKITKVETHLGDFFAKQKEKIEKIKKKDRFDSAVLKHIKNINSAFAKLKAEFEKQRVDATKYNLPKLKALADKLHEARYAAYRDYEHEKDAWAVGAAAAKAFNARAKKKK